MPIKSRTFATASLLLCGACSGLLAAPGGHYSVHAWTTGDGLPGSSITAMTRTRDNYLWLGTLYGLVRFDGIRFTTFDQNNTPGLNNSSIVYLFEDSQDNLWLGTLNSGIAVVRDGRVSSQIIAPGSRQAPVSQACEDSTHAIWLCTQDGQLTRHPSGALDGPNVTSNYFNNCRAVIAKDTGPVWVGTTNGLFSIDPAECQITDTPKKVRADSVTNVDFLLASSGDGFWCLADGRIQKWASGHLQRDFGPYPWDQQLTRVISACEDQDGNLVVGTYGDGVYWFDADGGYSHINSAQGLTHDSVLSLTVDREGCLWVGTNGGGLNRVKRSLFEVWKGTEGKTVQSVAEDDQGGLWVGYNGGGANGAVNYWKNDVRRQYLTAQDLYAIRSVFVDRDQNVWAGTWGAVPWASVLLQFQNGQFQSVPGSSAVSAIFQDRNGLLWVGTEVGLVSWDRQNWKIFTTQDGLSSDAVRAIADDTNGNLWIGTAGGGLNCLRDGKITPLRMDPALPGEDISALLVDHEGVLWIGTRGRGLERFHDGKWARCTTDNGLIGNSVSYLLEDGQDSLWIGSNAGLMRVRRQALNDFAGGLATYAPCRAYGTPDGLPTSECTFGSQPAALRAHDGKLWFPTIKGLAVLDPSRLVPNTNPPPVVIESILVEGVEQNTNGLRAKSTRSVTIPARKERLDIQYTSLNLASPDQVRFKYRLEGYETAWREVGRAEVGDIATAHYSRLPPGDYYFQVTACNEDGVWNPSGASFAVTVLPPFWRTPSFIITVSLCLLGVIVAIVHYFSTQKLQRQLEGLRQQQALEKDRSRIARDIHDQLGASLTQVSMLGEMVEIDKDSPVEVGNHARQISQTAREVTRALDEIVWAVNPSNDTLEGLVNYICSTPRIISPSQTCATGSKSRPACPTPPFPRKSAITSSSPPRNPSPTSSATPTPPPRGYACVWTPAPLLWKFRTMAAASPASRGKKLVPETDCATCANGWRTLAAHFPSPPRPKAAPSSA